jgi:hypothetical protein
VRAQAQWRSAIATDTFMTLAIWGNGQTATKSDAATAAVAGRSSAGLSLEPPD